MKNLLIVIALSPIVFCSCISFQSGVYGAVPEEKEKYIYAVSDIPNHDNSEVIIHGAYYANTRLGENMASWRDNYKNLVMFINNSEMIITEYDDDSNRYRIVETIHRDDIVELSIYQHGRGRAIIIKRSNERISSMVASYITTPMGGALNRDLALARVCTMYNCVK